MNSSSQSPSVSDIVRLVYTALDDKKAEDLCVLHVGRQSSITDYLVIATGTSEPHLRALRVELEKVLDAAKARIVGMDTEQGSGWLVVDAFDVMIHLFTPETRGNYKLESLWKDAETLTRDEIFGIAKKEPKAAKPVRKSSSAGKAPAKVPGRQSAAPKPARPVRKVKAKAKPAVKPTKKAAAKIASAKKSAKAPAKAAPAKASAAKTKAPARRRSS